MAETVGTNKVLIGAAGSNRIATVLATAYRNLAEGRITLIDIRRGRRARHRRAHC